MPIQTAPDGVMPNPFPGAHGAIHADAVAVIHSLVYANLWSAPGTKQNRPTARLDLQGYTAAGQMNLQVQVNGVGPPSTLSTVLVDATVIAVLPPNPASVPQQTEIVRRIKGALFHSLNAFETGFPRIWTVTGTPAN